MLTALRRTAQEWLDDKCPRLAAALAFYSLLALAPLLLVLVGLVSLVAGQGAAREAVVAQMAGLVGTAGAEVASEVLQNARPTAGVATAIGIVLLLAGATGVVAQLQDAMNTVWGVRARKQGWLRRLLLQRLLSLGFVVGMGFLLLVSLALSAAVTALGNRIGGSLATGALALLETALALAVFTAFLAIAYKVLPDAKVSWRDTWAGALGTSVLLVAGKWALGLYLGSGAFGSAFGAAASLAILLAWIYYTGLIFLFGAEYTQVRADLRGRPIVPSRGAERIVPERPVGALGARGAEPAASLYVLTAATFGMLAWVARQAWRARR